MLQIFSFPLCCFLLTDCDLASGRAVKNRNHYAGLGGDAANIGCQQTGSQINNMQWMLACWHPQWPPVNWQPSQQHVVDQLGWQPTAQSYMLGGPARDCPSRVSPTSNWYRMTHADSSVQLNLLMSCSRTPKTHFFFRQTWRASPKTAKKESSFGARK